MKRLLNEYIFKNIQTGGVYLHLKEKKYFKVRSGKVIMTRG